MLHAVHAHLLGTYADPQGIVLVRVDNLGDVVVQSRTEEDRLTIVPAFIQDRAHWFHETHVSHPISLVQDNDANVIKAQCAPVKKIDQPPRAGDQYLHTAIEPPQLSPVGGASVDRQHPETSGVGECLQDSPDLLRELPGGCEDQ